MLHHLGKTTELTWFHIAAPVVLFLALPAPGEAALNLTTPDGFTRASALLHPRPAANARRVAAEDLYAAFVKDRAAAALRFKGRPLAVTGIVAEVGRNDAGVAYGRLEAEGSFGGVLCHFHRHPEGSLPAVRVGQAITVRGLCIGGFGHVHLLA
jgi:hypothetical protein